ncbi:MAG: LPS export ABC transporter periplasmic protein LptC, partial [Pseudomonadota bacterium]|nr:LPS export ABC transporter periplasmic protein LptC [Pseudomonadota bacterium]
TWRIRAGEGWISPDNRVVRLEQAVTFTRPAASGERPVVITTRNVVWRPKDDYAETAEPVRAETPGGVLTGVGMKAYLNTQQFELLSEVRGRYEPPPKP